MLVQVFDKERGVDTQQRAFLYKSRVQVYNKVLLVGLWYSITRITQALNLEQDRTYRGQETRDTDKSKVILILILVGSGPRKS